jgi:uncharacterized protein YcfL
MSWAGRRKFLYISGIVLFLIIVIGVPVAYKLATIPTTCHDGKQDQGETSVDRGGPCLLLDDAYLQPHAVLWARSFQVRDGSYNAVAYIENPNKDAGVVSANYKFSLYDSQNVLIAERTGTTYIMPAGITPVFTAGINTGNRIVAHTYFVLTDPSLSWERMSNPSAPISVANKQVTNTDTQPQVSAIASNSSVSDITGISFVAVVYDTSGNAVNASATQVARLAAGGQSQIGFTWPSPFTAAVGSTDILPLMPPVPDPKALR